MGSRTIATAALGGATVALSVVLARRRYRAPDLTGRVALVTGGSRGLGLAIARELVHCGAAVAICARNRTQVDAAAAELRALGGEALGEVCDVADPDEAAGLVDRVVDWKGGLDIVVANAGTLAVGPLPTQDTSELEHALDVMLWGAWHPITAALGPLRRSPSPRIAVVSSIGGKLPVPHLLAYGVAKHAAVGLAETLRAELAAEGIPVTTVVPGLMRTGSHLHARMRGRPSAQFRWFGLGAVTPGLSMRADRAARRAVAGLARGDAELLLGLPTHVAVRAHGLAPGLGARLGALVQRGLPDVDPEDGPEPRAGASAHRDDGEARGVRGVDTAPGRGLLGRLGRGPARRHRQHTT